ncbi:tRNA N(3)-cytidine methyltransferase METTL6 isoform X1 [Equus przewalskii]|nr:methyltransferase-like protein 6 isoform X1 [Equus caballus]XP_023476677.1 methyltransferase-like protein 6 isoform X1 [Equus caballus]XP_023476678.1 methyltransferase-like protein 6 isoform X1 [Equus caballus]
MASLQRKGPQARILSSEEEEKLKRDQALVSDFKQQKLEKEAQKNWDLFYKRNSTNFFKDRHWTTREFEELRACREFEDQKLTMLEAGCGVGNCLFPLLEEDPNIFAYACDFSPRAVEYVKQNPLYDAERCKVFQCDLTKDDLLEHVPPESVDVVMLIFVLSAVHPDKMHLVLQNIYKNKDLLEIDEKEIKDIWRGNIKAKDETGDETQPFESASLIQGEGPTSRHGLKTTCFFTAGPLLMVSAVKATSPDLHHICNIAAAPFSLTPPSRSLMKCMLYFENIFSIFIIFCIFYLFCLLE